MGPRYKCKVCDNFDYCEECFRSKRSHKHPFNRVTDPGTYLSFPRAPRGAVHIEYICSSKIDFQPLTFESTSVFDNNFGTKNNLTKYFKETCKFCSR